MAHSEPAAPKESQLQEDKPNLPEPAAPKGTTSETSQVKEDKPISPKGANPDNVETQAMDFFDRAAAAVASDEEGAGKGDDRSSLKAGLILSGF